jgi:glycosyltransferase involved in cell wall biosynthesis
MCEAPRAPPAAALPRRADGGPPRLLYIVTEDWFFLSHRLPMARAAQAAGFEVHVAANVADGATTIAREGFVLHPVRFARGRLSPLATLATIRALRRLHRELAPDLVHHVALQPTILGSLAALGCSVARVNAITGLGYAFIAESFKARIVRRVIGTLLRLLVDRRRSVALVQNPDDRALLQGLGIKAERIVLIPGSGVDVDRLRPTPEPAGAVTLGFVGRLLDDKGIRVLVAAHRLLRAKGLPVDLLIAGTPDPANPASVSQAEAETWAREPGVTWLGHVDDIATVWARAHIAVLPSRREGLPKSLLEAAACGRAIVATDVPGCRVIARDGINALLVPPDDPAALAEAIDHMARDPLLRQTFAAAGRRMVEAEFSSARIGAETVALYDNLLGDLRRIAPPTAPR